MKPTIIYLLGAGASAGAMENEGLPIVQEIPSELEKFEAYLDKATSNDWDKAPNGLPVTYHSLKSELVQDTGWLRQATDTHASVDTFAKKLFITKADQDLHRLKTVLSLFFVYLQHVNRSDRRYDAFLASILSTQYFPDNIYIYSWNYDFQFEKAYAEYITTNSLDTVSNRLGVSLQMMPGQILGTKPKLVKLNGTTQFLVDNSPTNYIDLLTGMDTAGILKRLLEVYGLIKYLPRSHIPLLRFAWESDPELLANFHKDDAEDQSYILVVVGYSLPFFNRDIDRFLLGNFRTIKKIYVQDLNPDSVKSRLLLALPSGFSENKIQLVHQTDMFVLPDEL